MPIDNSCATKQTFCALNKQTPADNDEINFSFSKCIQQGELIEDTTWNEIITEIINIYNFGARGTRNPQNPLGLSDFTPITDNHQGKETINAPILTSYSSKLQTNLNFFSKEKYDEILNTITSMTNNQDQNKFDIFYGFYFDTIQNLLNNYQLNDDRCNNCNSGCNTSCQVSNQCCDSHCCTQCCTNSSSCSESGCIGCDCGGESHLSDCTNKS